MSASRAALNFLSVSRDSLFSLILSSQFTTSALSLEIKDSASWYLRLVSRNSSFVSYKSLSMLSYFILASRFNSVSSYSVDSYFLSLSIATYLKLERSVIIRFYSMLEVLSFSYFIVSFCSFSKKRMALDSCS